MREAHEVQAALAAVRGAEERVLLLASPPCPWLGPGRRALVTRGAGYTAPQHQGRGMALGVGAVAGAPAFAMEGPDDALVLRLWADRPLALHVNGGRPVVGAKLSAWHSEARPTHATRFHLLPDRTLVPHQGHGVVVGVEDRGTGLVLVPAESPLRVVLARCAPGCLPVWPCGGARWECPWPVSAPGCPCTHRNNAARAQA